MTSDTKKSDPLGWPGQPSCRYCGQALDRLRAGPGWCGSEGCALRHRNETVRSAYRESWNQHIARLKQGIDANGANIAAGARALGTEIADLPIGVVPRLTRPPVVSQFEFDFFL